MIDLDRITLFCIPYAGGSANAIYSRWGRLLPKTIQIVPLELAGHGKRMAEPFPANLQAVVADLLLNIAPMIRTNQYAIYGHSLGTTISYELVKAIKAAGMPPPLALFLSGRNPPHYSYPHRSLYLLEDDRFLNEIRKLGGTPDDFFKMKDLIKAFLPILRNDYRIIEQYRFEMPIHVTEGEITFFCSDADLLVTKPEIFEWKRYSHAELVVRDFPGGHFFINEQQEGICREIARTLTVLTQRMFV